ncbi:hypothetical protein GCM10020001_085770 [Nonomuraea salmonea]
MQVDAVERDGLAVLLAQAGSLDHGGIPTTEGGHVAGRENGHPWEGGAGRRRQLQSQRVPGWKGRWLSLRSTKPGVIMTTFDIEERAVGLL